MINAKDNINPDVLLDLVPYVSLIRINSSLEQVQKMSSLPKK